MQNAESAHVDCNFQASPSVFLKIKDLLFLWNISFYKKFLKAICFDKGGVFRKEDTIPFLFWNNYNNICKTQSFSLIIVKHKE